MLTRTRLISIRRAASTLPDRVTVVYASALQNGTPVHVRLDPEDHGVSPCADRVQPRTSSGYDTGLVAGNRVVIGP